MLCYLDQVCFEKAEGEELREDKFQNYLVKTREAWIKVMDGCASKLEIESIEEATRDFDDGSLRAIHLCQECRRLRWADLDELPACAGCTGWGLGVPGGQGPKPGGASERA